VGIFHGEKGSKSLDALPTFLLFKYAFWISGCGFQWIDPYDYKNKLLYVPNTLTVIVWQRDYGKAQSV